MYMVCIPMYAGRRGNRKEVQIFISGLVEVGDRSSCDI